MTVVLLGIPSWDSKLGRWVSRLRNILLSKHQHHVALLALSRFLGVFLSPRSLSSLSASLLCIDKADNTCWIPLWLVGDSLDGCSFSCHASCGVMC